jgi:hypothetical protein
LADVGDPDHRELLWGRSNSCPSGASCLAPFFRKLKHNATTS